MKIDMENVFIGTVRKCIEYKMHTTYGSRAYIGDVCLGEDSFGYVVSDSIAYKKMLNY